MEEIEDISKSGKKLYEKFNKICEKIQKNQNKNDKLIIELESFKESLLKFLQPKQKRTINVETSGLLKKKELTSKSKKIISEIINEAQEGEVEVLELSRQDATKILCNYINEKGLKCEDNKRYFQIDENLAHLFDIEQGTKLTYPNMQKYLNIIFKPDCEYYPTEELVEFLKKEKKKINKKNKIELIDVYNIFNEYKLKNNLGDSKKIKLNDELLELFNVNGQNKIKKAEISITKMKDVIKNSLLIKKCLID